MEKTKKALGTLLKISSVLVADLKDNKIDFGEAMGLAFQGTKLIGVFKDIPEIKEELKTITAEKATELVEEFKKEFDLPNDELELKIEAGLEVLAQMALMIFTKQS